MNEQLTDPKEIRKYLRERVYGRWPNGPHTVDMSAPLIHTVLIYCEKQGYSGEDTMTLLAYQALLRADDYAERLMKLLDSMPSPPIIMDAKP
jgi:hypothetical protein